MFNLALITRVDWSQQGLSLWGSRGLSLISPWLLIIGTSPGLKETSVHFPILCQYRSNIFRPFFLSLDHSYRLTSHLKNFPKGFLGGVWKLRVSNSHISSNSLYQTSVHSNQTNKPNQTRISPARSHTPNETKGKDMPRNQEPSGKSAPKRW